MSDRDLYVAIVLAMISSGKYQSDMPATLTADAQRLFEITKKALNQI